MKPKIESDVVSTCTVVTHRSDEGAEDEGGERNAADNTEHYADAPGSRAAAAREYLQRQESYETPGVAMDNHHDAVGRGKSISDGLGIGSQNAPHVAVAAASSMSDAWQALRGAEGATKQLRLEQRRAFEHERKMQARASRICLYSWVMQLQEELGNFTGD